MDLTNASAIVTGGAGGFGSAAHVQTRVVHSSSGAKQGGQFSTGDPGSILNRP